MHTIGIATPRLMTLPTLKIPQAHRIVLPRAAQPLIVGTDGDRQNVERMTVEPMDTLPILKVPQTQVALAPCTG